MGNSAKCTTVLSTRPDEKSLPTQKKFSTGEMKIALGKFACAKNTGPRGRCRDGGARRPTETETRGDVFYFSFILLEFDAGEPC